MDLSTSPAPPPAAPADPARPSTAARTGAPPPLVVSADEDLLARLLPLAAAADVAATVARDPIAALVAFGRAPVVLVGADLASALADLAPASRPRVVVVSPGPAPHALFRDALRLGADQVVELPGCGPWLVELLADLTEHLPERARVIGVLGATGGAGATTLACALGQWAARTAPTAVIDCDPQGPGLDRMLGLERSEGFRWDALCQTTGRLSARALREALPRAGRLGVLSWYVGGRTQTLQAFAVREVLSAARRGHGTVVVDLPRWPDPLVDEVAARCDDLLVVTHASVTGVAGATRMRARFAGHGGVRLVLRGDAFSADDVARAVGLPVAAAMRDQRGLAESVDLGLGPLRSPRGPLARAVAAILQEPMDPAEPIGPAGSAGPVGTLA